MNNSQSSQTRLQTLLHDFHSITHIDVSYALIFPAADIPNAALLKEGMNSFMTQLLKVPVMKEHLLRQQKDVMTRITEYQETFCSFEPFPG